MIKPNYKPVPFTSVAIQDEFWTPRLRVNRDRTLPVEYDQCQQTGRIDAFRLGWHPGEPNKPHYFWDSDVAKWIEAASYSLGTHPDPELDRRVDEVIALVASAQQPDGYLNIYYTVVEPGKRWTNLRDRHELYCAGHLIEAGVAHFRATGKRTLLDVVARYADYIGTVFGRGPGQKRGYCGHEEIELALYKLYRVTGDKRYLAQSQYFIDERGRPPHYFDLEAAARGEDPKNYWAGTHAYTQSHRPVREQQEVVGHAVRAMYLYSAMADLAGETGDERLRAACERLWQDLCARKLYITGGIGPSAQNEGFTTDYDLPNETAYAETCAAIGLVFWNHRLLQLQCDRKYADVMERALYNGVLGGVSLDGARFFYENPLASNGSIHRQPWFDCACCPPNLARLLASLGEYIYGIGENEIAVHLYIGGAAQFEMGGQPVTVTQETRYPWKGRVDIQLDLARPASFTLRPRIPGWCRAARLSVNGEPVEPLNTERGYARLEREWQRGDRVRLELDMPVEQMQAHPDVSADVGKVALQRGPLVYCVEQADYVEPVGRLRLSPDAILTAEFDPDLLGGVVNISGQALAAQVQDWEGALYRPSAPTLKPVPLTAVPYYAWDNRVPGAMRVWLPTAGK